MIIVEGFDGSGKTTVARQIAHRTGFDYMHAGSKPKDLTASLNRCHTMMRLSIVQDRVTQISEAVYGMLTRFNNAETARARLSDLSTARLLVYCRPPIGVILANLAEHDLKAHDIPEDVAHFKENARFLIDQYDSIIESARDYVQVTTYDYTLHQSDELLHFCMRILRE